MSKEEAKIDHTGWKYLHLVLGMILATIWGLFSFFSWLTGISTTMLTNFSYGFVGILIYILFAFIWEILWRFFHKAGGKFDSYNDNLNFKYLALILALLLGVIWTLFNFFTWIVSITPATLVNYSYGILGITIMLFFFFVYYILWAFFHKVSEKLV